LGILDSLIEQAKNPRGFIGSVMLKMMNSAHAEKIAWGLSKAAVDEDALVLDIGCGGGEAVKMLSPLIKTGKIYGVDYSEDAVSATVKKNKKDVQSGKMIVQRASVSSIPFQDNFFDIAFAFQTHYFWPDLKHDIREVNRVIKPDGRFVLVSEIYKINYHMKEYTTIDEMKELLFISGFSSVSVFETKKDWCFVSVK
jgi:ubiquinone/menaquinone biosynthesis C-methylase UbiE